MESYSRVRSVKLRRHSEDIPFGFSVRGGHEHGTGVFVSFVDPRSIAYKQGLKVGDQILRVNGFAVSSAVHHEVLSLMRVRPSLHLKVRSVGMIPVKEKTGDPLTWKLVEEQPSPSDLTDGHGPRGHSRLSDTSSSTAPEGGLQEAKIFIDISGQSGLGCCICKGPPERPGIFVQSTKHNGVAREAGLRPGDQLLSCNGHSFLHIPFPQAVGFLKSSKTLALRVLKGAAVDLFPGESSGYNSSASSLNGESAGAPPPSSPSSSTELVTVHPVPNHPNPHEAANRRLTCVTEEKRLVPLDERMEWDEVERVWRSAERETIVIEVKGVECQQAPSPEEARLAEERRKLEETERRLAQQALQLDEEKRRFEEEKRRTLANGHKANGNVGEENEETPPTNSSGNSLVGALHQEILKRNERRESRPEDERPKPGTVETKRSLFNGQIDQEKRQQHEQLIEEFKRAHRKMFAHSMAEEAAAAAKEASEGVNKEMPSPDVRARRVQKELDHERQMVAQRVAGIVRQRQLRIERQHQEVEETEREIRTKSPPPPPPMPAANFKKKNPAPPPPTLTAAVNLPIKNVIIEEKSGVKGVKGTGPAPPPPQRVNSALGAKKKKTEQGVVRPESPSPDYSNSPSPIPSPPRQHKPIGVDMQSLESFRLKDPPQSPKKPPPVYFSHNNPQMIGNQTRLVSGYQSSYPESRDEGLIIQKELEDALAKCNLNNKRLISGPSGGGILKMSNSVNNPSVNNPKTISFVGKY